jgi:hypothetical protein
VAGDYAPKPFLRQAENKLLQEYFSRKGLLQEIDWESIGETDVDDIHVAWEALPVQQRVEIESDFQLIYDLASEDGIRILIEEGRFQDIDLKPALDAHDGFLNKSFLVFLEYRDVFEVAYDFDRADNLNRRSWKRRKGLPRKEPDLSLQARDELKDAVAAYFRERQGRGRHCHLDVYLRWDRCHYFFLYPQDYTSTTIEFDSNGRFQRRPLSPAFEVIYVYDPLEGALDLYARGKKGLKEDLQKIFSRSILHEDLPKEDKNAPPYELNRLKRRSFAFPTDPVDGVREVRIRELKFSVIGNYRHRIALEVSPDGPVDEIYDFMDRILNSEVLPLTLVDVRSAVIQMRFNNTDGHGGDVKTISFRISYPDSCNLRDKPEHIVARKYLKKWEIERAEHPLADPVEIGG